jgi:uncharacterized membrane protein
MNRVIDICKYALLGFLLVLMILITVPYFAFDDHTAFLRIKQSMIDNSIWKTSFYIHVLTSCFSIIAGFTQFSKQILRKNARLHRTIGKMYVVVVLLLSGPSGFVMALYANGGILSQTAFTILSVLWMYFTYKAFDAARNRDFAEHEKFMIRSFALTLSAITLRAWKYILVLTFRPPPMDAYMIVAWLGWVPNLIIAEIIIARFVEKRITQGKSSI